MSTSASQAIRVWMCLLPHPLMGAAISTQLLLFGFPLRMVIPPMPIVLQLTDALSLRGLIQGMPAHRSWQPTVRMACAGVMRKCCPWAEETHRWWRSATTFFTWHGIQADVSYTVADSR